MKIGIDLGNGFVKCNGSCFASKVRAGKLAAFGTQRENVHEVVCKVNGVLQHFVVGEGEAFTTADRYFTIEYKMCLLTAIACASSDLVIDAEICVGLPVMQFMSPVRFELQKHLEDMKEEKITLDGNDRIIKIKKVTVFVEGAYVIETKDTNNVITIDIGAGTVNVIQWENQGVLHYDTYDKSFLNLYAKISKHLKDTGRGTVSPAYIEKHLGEDTYIIDQKEVSVVDTHFLIEQHVRSLATKIKEGVFDLASASKIQILGGGAAPTFKYWQKMLGDGVELVADSQFVNSKIFDKVVNM